MAEEVSTIIQIINHIPYKGDYAYFVYGEDSYGKHKYLWMNSKQLKKKSRLLVENYWKNNKELHIDEDTNTDQIFIETKPKFIIKPLNSNLFVDTKIIGSPPKNLLDGGMPRRIVSFNKKENAFLVSFADSPATVLVPADIMLDFSPDLVVNYFMDKQNK